MNKEKTKTKETISSPSRLVWRTQMSKGVHTPHRVSRITCVFSNLMHQRVLEHLTKLGICRIFVENGRNVREFIKKRPFGLPGKSLTLQDYPVEVFRFTVPRESAQVVVTYLVDNLELYIPGRGMIFSQDLIEFNKTEPPLVNIPDKYLNNPPKHDYTLLDKMAYVNCVLSEPGSGEKLAKIALDLGICVPFVTNGYGTDFRDNLGLIRITISPEKEIVHLVMPEQDTDSIIRLLIEEGRLNKPGKGFIYRTPVSFGLLDTRMRIGRQEYAASIEQIIAAIDQLKMGTNWRKRLDVLDKENVDHRFLVPSDNCELQVISEEDRIDKIIEAGLDAGATGATTTRVKRLIAGEEKPSSAARVLSTISLPAGITNEVVDALLQVSSIDSDSTDRLQVLDSPAAYVHSW
jgi:nitrogen regulatory protein PII